MLPLKLLLLLLLGVGAVHGSVLFEHELRKADELDQPCNQSDYESLSSAVKLAYERLQATVQSAEVKGINCSYEKVSLRVASLFQTFAGYDFLHPNDASSVGPLRRRRGDCCRAGRTSQRQSRKGCMCETLPSAPTPGLACTELARTQTVLEDAAKELRLLLNNTHLSRFPTADHRMLGVEERDGYFYRPETGKPVFPGGYDQGIWKYFYGFPTDNETEVVVSLGHSSDELSISIASVMPLNETYINETFLDFLKSRLDYFQQLGLSLSIYTGCELPQWAVEKYPDLELYLASNCHYNLDVPELSVLWNRTLISVYSHLNAHPALHSFRLGNEVWFGIYGNKTHIGQVTVDRWHQWLESAYHGNLTRLNHLYGTHYANFKNVPINGKFSKGSFHPDPPADYALISRARDVALFLNYRSFFHWSNMIAGLQSVNASVKSHIKFVDGGSFSSWSYGGANRIDLNGLTTWVGCDTRIMPYPVERIKTPHRDAQQYALDWLPAAIGYTFMRTTAGNKVVIDQEVHPITISAYHNTSIAFGHVTAAMWVAHLHGLSMNLIWAWSRYVNGTPSDILYGSLLTQPQTLNDYARSMAYINAIAEEVHALAMADRPVCLFYNGQSKLNNEKDFFDSFVDTFEALEFSGFSVAMVTDRMLDESSTCLDPCQLLIIPKTIFIDGKSLAAFTNFHNSGKPIVFVSASTGDSMPEPIFAFSEIGERWSNAELSWTKKIPNINDQKPKSLLSQLLAYAESIPRHVQCLNAASEENSAEAMPAWGVMCKYAKLNSNSTGTSTVLALVNTLNAAAHTIVKYTARIGSSPLQATNLYMNQTVDLSVPLLLEPLQVIILRLNV